MDPMVASTVRTAAILAVRPRVVQRRGPGSWFAVSPEDAPVRVGVEADSEAEVRSRFDTALRAWADLAVSPDPRPRGYVS